MMMMMNIEIDGFFVLIEPEKKDRKLTNFFLLSPYFGWSGKEKIFGLTRDFDFDFDFLYCLVLKQQSGSNVRLPLFIRKIDHLEFSFYSFIFCLFFILSESQLIMMMLKKN